MSTAPSRTTYTPEDLLNMPEGDRYELVDGQLVEKPMGARSSYVGSRLARFLGNHCDTHNLGEVWGADCGYQCFPSKPSQVRRPDVSFVRRDRRPGGRIPDGHMPVAPDLVAEVLSPNDLDYETDQRVDDYLAAGVKLVWVINPERSTVLIYRGDGTIAGLRENAELDGEDVVAGFRCTVRDVLGPFGGPAEPVPETS